MQTQQQNPAKAFYLDRLGNMSTSSSHTTSTNSVNNAPPSIRKEILPLKPKQQNTYVQHLEIKTKKAEVPVTTLELKSKLKTDKNRVTKLEYRKPIVGIRDMAPHHTSECIHRAQLHQGPPSSSGYETDTLPDLETNYDLYAALFENALSSAFCPISGHQGFLGQELDMLHTHPVWTPLTNLYPYSGQ